MIPKKKKKIESNSDYISINNSSYSNTNPKSKDKVKGNKSSINKKIEKCFTKIQNHQYANLFYNPNDTSSNSLLQIEKKVKNGQYKSTNELFVDLRQLWCHYFQMHSKNPEIFQKVNKISQFCEDIYKESKNIHEDKGNLNEINRVIDEIDKDIKDMKVNKAPFKGDAKYKEITLQEKSDLGNKIRKLNKEQLKGIVKLLTDSNDFNPNQKFYEFDIDKLSQPKLRELQKYVENCNKDNRATNVKTYSNVDNNDNNNNIQQLKTDLLQQKTEKNQINNNANKHINNDVDSISSSDSDSDDSISN